MTENMVIDPSFRNPLIWPTGSGYEFVRDGVFPGGGALEIGPGAGTRSITIPLKETVIPALPGERWTAAAAYRTTPDWNGSNGNSKYRLADQAGTLLGGGTVTLNGPAEQWTWVEKTSFTIPAGSTGIRATIVADNTAGKIWWDELRLYKVREADGTDVPTNLVAGDDYTLQVVPEPSYIRMYYLLQPSALNPPAPPTTNPPAAPWSINEPNFSGMTSTDTLYTTLLSVWSDGAFQYGPVQVSAQFEAAKQAYNEALSAKVLAQTADGRITVSTAAPLPEDGVGKPTGAIWYVQSGANYTSVHEWTGASWALRTLTDATIANLSASKLNAGTVNASRIGAGTISTAKLMVTSITSLVDDGGFEYQTSSGVSWTFGSGVTSNTSTPRTGARCLRIPTSTAAFTAATQVSAFQVEEGQQYRVEAWVKLDSGTVNNVGVVIRFNYGATESTATIASEDIAPTPEGTTSTYALMSGVWTVPAGAKWAKTCIVCRDTTSGRVYKVDDVAVYKMNSAELIVDGAIRSQHIEAESIIGEHIQAGAIDTPQLKAGSVVSETLAAESVTAEALAVDAVQANHISVGAIKTSHISSEVGQELNLENNDAINFIVGRVESVEDGVEGNGAELEDIRKRLQFDADGLTLSNPGSVFATNIDDDSINMLENGNVISYWNSGTLFVNQLVGESVTLGNHQIAKFETGTVIRWLGV